MQLYYTPGACSLSPHIVAREAGIPVTLEKVDLKTHKTARGEDYYAVNPKGYVPALKLDDGNTLTEGPAIVQYLADRKPESGLAPPNGTFARYKLQEWLTFINGEIHKPFGALFSNSSDATRKEAIEKINKRFAWMEKQLGDKPFLSGDTFTVADAYFFVMLTWAHHHRIDTTPYPKLEAYFTRVKSRPKVLEAMKEEGLVK
ncbi:MAG TPA: glutathione transferase GstA [Rhizomicrobium sp.]|jgi:glutathione S-transferase|nr:glutathione transferase GstA [Rhizomicrobium sp.]